MSSELDCRLVSSRGILKSCDIWQTPPVSSVKEAWDADWANIPLGAVVYVHGSALADWVVRFLPLLRNPIVLVSGDCDETMPRDVFSSERAFSAFVENPMISHWFSQNLLVSHPKCTRIPIGLDYHTLTERDFWWGPRATPREQEDELLKIRDKAWLWESRQPNVFCNFQFEMNAKLGQDRRDAIAQMNPAATFFADRMSRRETWAEQAKFQYVACPTGNGFDCHRTWEALALGCIPIVKRSGIDPLYCGFTMLIVDDWSEVTPARLKRETGPSVWLARHQLRLAYWVDQIRAAQGLTRP
jgi:hypothetical protein